MPPTAPYALSPRVKFIAREGARLLVRPTFVALFAACATATGLVGCGAATGLEDPTRESQSVDGALADSSIDGDQGNDDAPGQPVDGQSPIDGSLPPTGDAAVDTPIVENDAPSEPDAIEPSDGPEPPTDGGRPGTCMASCTVDTDCVEACGTPRNGNYCCDTASGTCFHARGMMCPVAGADGGMGGS
jgi:hypothetical protein